MKLKRQTGFAAPKKTEEEKSQIALLAAEILARNGGTDCRTAVQRATWIWHACHSVSQTQTSFPSGDFTPKAKLALESARQEADLMRHRYVGTEHILLSLACETDGICAKVFAALGLDEKVIRQAILDAA